MTLEFKKISKEFTRLSKQAAQRKQAIDTIAPQVWQILQDHRLDQELQNRARERALSKHSTWRGAIPTDEPLDLIADAPESFPNNLTVIAGDGSQIYPDLHSPALYYLINVGTIVFKHGSREAPEVDTDARIYDETDMGFDEEEQAVLVPSTAEIDARRSVAEIEKILTLARVAVDNQLTVVLLDGQMALYVNESAMPKNLASELLQRYIHSLDELHELKIPVAGFFSRRRSMMVTSLARLANEPDSTQTLTPPFLGVPDTAIFAQHLSFGKRSAVFEIASRWNQDYRKKGHSIYFFYTNVSKTAIPDIARVEVPEWVARDKSMLNTVHSAIVEQCKSLPNYPYVLARAHELAVVKEDERTAFEEMLLTRLAGEGIYSMRSGKARAKNL